jgi:hypothetical protein
MWRWPGGWPGTCASRSDIQSAQRSDSALSPGASLAPGGLVLGLLGQDQTVTIIRNDDGSLTVPVTPGRHDDEDNGVASGPEETVLWPGQSGYVEALAQWEEEQHPDRGEAVSTASGHEQAMTVVQAVAEDPDRITEAVEALEQPEAAGEALRHVLVGGDPSVDAFAAEVAEAKGDDPLPSHKATGIIGEVLAEIDNREG